MIGGSPERFEELEMLWILVELRIGVHPRRLIIVEQAPSPAGNQKTLTSRLAAQDKMPATGRMHWANAYSDARLPSRTTRVLCPRKVAEERGKMDKGRLEAFSDGVIAIIITIMVLEM